MNWPLKKIIHESERKAYEIARALDWQPSKLSQIINEVYTPSSIEMELLSEELAVPVDELFPHRRPRVKA